MHPPFFKKSISDRRERIIGAVRHRMNSASQANRRAYRMNSNVQGPARRVSKYDFQLSLQ